MCIEIIKGYRWLCIKHVITGVIAHVRDPSTREAEQEDLQSEFFVTLKLHSRTLPYSSQKG